MPFVFKFSLILIVAALVGGQSWQHLDAAPDTIAYADTFRVGCPGVSGLNEVVTKGDAVRFFDAYLQARIGGLVGLGDGCAA